MATEHMKCGYCSRKFPLSIQQSTDWHMCMRKLSRLGKEPSKMRVQMCLESFSGVIVSDLARPVTGLLYREQQKATKGF